MPHQCSLFLSRVLCLSAAIAVASCGGGDSGGTASCTLSENIGSLGTIKICEEGSGSARASLAQACKSSTSALLADAGVQMSMTFADAPCSHVNAVGGCQVTQGGETVAIWYYQDPTNSMSTSDVQNLCSTAGEKYLTP